MYGSILGMWHLYVYGLFISPCSLHCLEALKVNVDSTTRRDLHAMSDRLHDNIHWRNERCICMQQLFPLAMGAQNILSLLYTHDSIMNTWLNDKHGQEGFVVYECTFIHPSMLESRPYRLKINASSCISPRLIWNLQQTKE